MLSLFLRFFLIYLKDRATQRGRDRERGLSSAGSLPRGTYLGALDLMVGGKYVTISQTKSNKHREKAKQKRGPRFAKESQYKQQLLTLEIFLSKSFHETVLVYVENYVTGYIYSNQSVGEVDSTSKNNFYKQCDYREL